MFQVKIPTLSQTTRQGWGTLFALTRKALCSAADSRARLSPHKRSPKLVLLFHNRGVGVGGLGFVGVNLSVVFGVEGTVLGVHILWSHGEDVAVFLAFEVCGVVSALGVDHALGERSGVHEVSEGSGEVVVLFVELVLGTDDDAHVSEGGGLRIGAGRIAGELGFVGGSRGVRFGHGSAGFLRE